MRLIAAVVLLALPVIASAEEPRLKRTKTDDAIDRGLAFLVKDAVAWKKEHNCASCHHAALVVWALREAKQRGRTVDEPFLTEYTKWVAESGDGKTGIPRPAGIPKALNAKAVWFALALGADPKPDATAQKGLETMLKTVKGDQTENGSWASWPETRPPIFGNSDESMTALAVLSLLPLTDEASKAALDKGVKWLSETKSDNDPQSVAMRLVLWKRLGRPAKELEPLVQHIKDRQNEDGGWSQAKGMTSDAWATGQALYALAEAGIKSDEKAIERGRAFLIKTQREDGSWPMMSRPTKPGDKVVEGKTAITGAGSSWAVLGLVRGG